MVLSIKAITDCRKTGEREVRLHQQIVAPGLTPVEREMEKDRTVARYNQNPLILFPVNFVMALFYFGFWIFYFGFKTHLH